MQAEARFAGAGLLMLVPDALGRLPELGVAAAAHVGPAARQQWHDDHGRVLVFCHQTAGDACARDVLAQRVHRAPGAVELVGQDGPADETLLGDFGPSDDRRPDRLHPCAVDAGQQEELLVDLPEALEEARVVDVAIQVLDNDGDRVAQAAQVSAVGQVVLDVGVTLGQHALEARAQHQPAQLEREDRRQQQADDEDRSAVIEDEPLQA